MKIILHKNILIAFMLGLVIISCEKDGKLNYKPNIAIPLVKASFTLKDILKKESINNNISIASDGFIDLIFRTKLFSQKAEDLIPIINQNFNSSLKLDVNQTNAANLLPAGNSLPTITFNRTFPLNLGAGIFIDTVTLKSGKLHLIINSSYPLDFELTLKMPGAIKNGNLLSIPISRNGTPPLSVDTIIDLSNYKISLDNSSSSNPNVVNFEMSLKLTKNINNQTLIDQLDSIALNFGFEEFKFKKLYGRFSNFEIISEPDTVPISIFESSLGLGSIRVDNPKLTTNFSNSFGVNVNASFPKFTGYNELSNPNTKNFTGTGVPTAISPLVLVGAQIIGQSVNTSFELNSNNSNIVDIINLQPKKVIYQIKAIANTINSGFILDTSKIDIDMEIDLPMSGTIDDFIFRDTIDFAFEQTKNIESVSLRTIINNGFPFETNVQVYFANEKNVVLDSLVKDKSDQIIIASAKTNANGIVIGDAIKQQSDLTIGSTVIPKLETVRKLIVQARNSSYQKKKIKIYDSYNMDIRLGVKTKLNI